MRTTRLLLISGFFILILGFMLVTVLLHNRLASPRPLHDNVRDERTQSLQVALSRPKTDRVHWKEHSDQRRVDSNRHLIASPNRTRTTSARATTSPPLRSSPSPLPTTLQRLSPRSTTKHVDRNDSEEPSATRSGNAQQYRSFRSSDRSSDSEQSSPAAVLPSNKSVVHWTPRATEGRFEVERGRGASGGKGKGRFRKYTVEQMEARMDADFASGLLSVQHLANRSSERDDRFKLVGMVAVRNVGANVRLFLRLLARLTDAIVLLDDCSDDDTVQATLDVAAECRVEAIVRKRQWIRNEAQDKNVLLRVARSLGATHYIVPDYDETVSAACLQGDYLRTELFALPYGARLQLHWREYWNGVRTHRVDPKQPSTNFLSRFLPIMFRDTRTRRELVPEKDLAMKIHYPRIPVPASSPVRVPANRDCLILEFRFVSVVNVYLKRIWYACFGVIHGSQTMALGRMNKLLDEEATVRDADPSWMDEQMRTFALTFDRIETWRVRNILDWIDEYGDAKFRSVSMWQVPWSQLRRVLDERDALAGAGLGELRADDFDGIRWHEERFMPKQRLKGMFDNREFAHH